MISMSDIGIGSELIDFILLLLVGNSSPEIHNLTTENSKPLKFDIFMLNVLIHGFLNKSIKKLQF